MKWFFTVFFCVPFWVSAQSPLDFGQHEKVYYISPAQAEDWGIEEMLSFRVNQYKGGMHEYVDITKICPTEDYEMASQWFPAYPPEDSMDLETSLAHARFLNGQFYSYSNDLPIYSGGEGYGTMCNCYYFQEGNVIYGAFQCEYETEAQITKYVFDAQGRLRYNTGGGRIPAENYDRPFADLPDSLFRDTLWFSYAEAGYLNALKEGNHEWYSYKLPAYPIPDFANFDIRESQIYFGETLMEDFMQEHTGMLPEVVLVGFYKFGAFTFYLSEKEQKYILGAPVHLFEIFYGAG